jgi:small subunit ribosomal protein S9
MKILQKSLIISSKRKTAIGKATIREGSGKITINKREIAFFPILQQLEMQEPLLIAEKIIGKANYDIQIKVTGGGLSSQVEAARLAIARAIVAFTKSDELKRAYIVYDRNMFVADTRRKEAYKPGDSKARANRQTSYR